MLLNTTTIAVLAHNTQKSYHFQWLGQQSLKQGHTGINQTVTCGNLELLSVMLYKFIKLLIDEVQTCIVVKYMDFIMHI